MQFFQIYLIKDIEKLCDEAANYHFASVCVAPYYVSLAKNLLKDSDYYDHSGNGEKYVMIKMVLKIKKVCPAESSAGFISFVRLHHFVGGKVMPINELWYHGENEAHGLSFSVREGVPMPPSLRNIFKELQNDIGVVRTQTDLTDWAKQGVLLLNAIMTVVKDTPLSHKDKGWEIFTDRLIELLGEAKLIIFLQNNKYLAPLFSSIIGVIPNCASSVVLSELYIINGLSFGALLSGLLMNAGLGLVYLFKKKENVKMNINVVVIMFIISLIVGYLTCLINGF